eukprot:TRINITY_DN1320_c9_g1_i1.p1 TRINITY_DN1320_c9_g1~~TRINITY_DN1320_c9_g1_i1.p1  ORF type:complete len:576 (+),score=189.75 TRINITY_DN1320_c9_g1_i1:51-1730(+)
MLNISGCQLVSEGHGRTNSEAWLRQRIDQLEQFIDAKGLEAPVALASPPESPASRAADIMSCSLISEGPPRRPGPPPPQNPTTYRLSSQVLTMTREGMIHKSLAEIIAETAGRVDVREPDTPAGYSAGENVSFGSFGEEPEKKDKRSKSLESPKSGPLSKVTGLLTRSTSPKAKAPTSPTSAPLVKEKKKVPALDKQMLDRIATVHSLQALRTDKMLHKPFPPLARQAMDYVAAAYNEMKNTFSHDIDKFYKYLRGLCDGLTPIMEKEPIYVYQQSPCYTFGDTHGNYGDVSYFLENIINFIDLEYTPCNLIFLGDYVDRGSYGLEVLCLLMSLKLSNPQKVTLLRGNHEDPLVNGDVRHYGESAFQRQCVRAFGNARGVELWTKMNELFRHFPLACEIDHKIFCSHGGIPRYEGGQDRRLETLRDPLFPHLEVFSTFEPAVDQPSRLVQMASDLCWSDPKDWEDDEGYYSLNDHGFGNNTRGDGVICFGTKAVDNFCDRYGFDFIFRAHQEKSDGLKLAKSGRVITIFSSSDYEGHRNGAGVLFVNTQGEIRMIMKSA